MSAILSESYSFIWQPKVRMKSFFFAEAVEGWQEWRTAAATPAVAEMRSCMVQGARLYPALRKTRILGRLYVAPDVNGKPFA